MRDHPSICSKRFSRLFRDRFARQRKATLFRGRVAARGSNPLRWLENENGGRIRGHGVATRDGFARGARAWREAGAGQTPLNPSKKKPLRVMDQLPEIWALMRPRRGLLAIGLVLMAINRVSGLALPYTTKYLVDNVMIHHQTRLLMPLVGGVLLATMLQGRDLLHADANAIESGAADDHRAAEESAGARRAPAGRVLRCEQNGRAGLAHHERRRRRAEPDRHGARGISGRIADGGHRSLHAAAHQSGDDGARGRDFCS